MLGELEGDGQVVIGDLEAGIGTVMRLREGMVDLVVVVAQPTAKSLDIAARAARVARGRGFEVTVVANRVRDDEDLTLVASALPDEHIVTVPDDPAILHADEEGRAPIDAANGSPGIDALVSLAARLAASP